MRGSPDRPDAALNEGDLQRVSDVPNAGAYVFQRRDHGLTRCWPRWGERYVEGRVVVHLHARIHVGAPAQNLCAVVERADAEMRHMELLDESGTGESHARTHHDRTGEMHPSMLVNVGEFVEHPQQVLVGIPSVIRLNALNECLYLETEHAPKLVETTGPSGRVMPLGALVFPPVGVEVIEDRELGSLEPVPDEVFSQVVDDVIQR